MKHISVLLNESIDGLSIKNGDVIVDGTLGGGGHTNEIIRRFKDDVKIIGIDEDIDAILRSKELMKNTKSDVIFINDNFENLDQILSNQKIKKVDKILLDLGISSFQLEESGRGFSFLKNEPLSMTMKKNPNDNDLTAGNIVNTWSRETLEDILYGFGEEKYSRKIVDLIIKRREEKEIKTTFDLVGIIEEAVGGFYKGKRIHSATKTFQALRIATNSELLNLEKVINIGFDLLSKNGRMAIISFHSLEDRIVKQSFVRLKNNNLGKILNKKPIVPSIDEIKLNPRSRSSKLRLIEKI